MFNKKTCPNCMSFYKGRKCKNCGYIDSEEKPGLRTVWKFIIILALLQIVIGTFASNFIWALFLTIFAWGVLLSIPCIIRYGMKKNLSKKMAIIYTVISSIILLFGNAFISIIANETVTLWNLIMMIVPYYILIDEPMFSLDKKKKDASEK